ncbi:MAG TPA: hypothetical protein VF859_03300, partial [Burkholderiales bacterium]
MRSVKACRKSGPAGSCRKWIAGTATRGSRESRNSATSVRVPGALIPGTMVASAAQAHIMSRVWANCRVCPGPQNSASKCAAGGRNSGSASADQDRESAATSTARAAAARPALSAPAAPIGAGNHATR